MQIEFSYEKKQVLQALRYHFLTRPEVKLLLIVINVFAILSAALFFMRMISPYAFLVSSLLWLLLILVFWWILPRTVYKRASTFKDHFVMTFNEQRIFLQTAKGYTEWAWGTINTWLESANFFHLYFDSRSFFLIPKDSLEDEERYYLRDLLKQKITK